MIYVAGKNRDNADTYCAFLQRNGIPARPVFSPEQLYGLKKVTVIVADGSFFYRKYGGYAMDIAICNARRS